MSAEYLAMFGPQPPLPVKVGDIVEYPRFNNGYYRVTGVEGGKVHLGPTGKNPYSMMFPVTQEGSVAPVTREALLRRAAELIEIANTYYPEKSA